jgi:hypothetical protein
MTAGAANRTNAAHTPASQNRWPDLFFEESGAEVGRGAKASMVQLQMVRNSRE